MIAWDEPPRTTDQRRREAVEAVIYSIILLALLALMAWDETRPATEWVTGRDTGMAVPVVGDRHPNLSEIAR